MKLLLFCLILLLFSPVLKGAEPVLETRCETGGEFGNIVTLNLSKDFRYGKLTIKRTLTGSDLTRDVGTFVGGDYRLDIAAKGGITGYSLEYAAKDPAAAFATTEGTLTCVSSPVSTTPETIPASEPPPAPIAPTVPSSPPVSSPEPAQKAPVAPVTAPTEIPTTPEPSIPSPSPVTPPASNATSSSSSAPSNPDPAPAPALPAPEDVPQVTPNDSSAPATTTSSNISVEAGRLPTPTTSTTPPLPSSQAPSAQPDPSVVPVAPSPTTTEPDLQ
ncbi:MAG: hypothetical protein HY541_09175 [Deltaproteobacteria bacterium]|nr:hypothetical protein [Deltaproteobacteria bacterium]